MISETMRAALSAQLNREFRSAFVYLAMSAYCSHEELNGAANWMKRQYEEEQQHATKVYDYLVEQGAAVSLAPIDVPNNAFDSLLEVFEALPAVYVERTLLQPACPQSDV